MASCDSSTSTTQEVHKRISRIINIKDYSIKPYTAETSAITISPYELLDSLAKLQGYSYINLQTVNVTIAPCEQTANKEEEMPFSYYDMEYWYLPRVEHYIVIRKNFLNGVLIDIVTNHPKPETGITQYIVSAEGEK